MIINNAVFFILALLFSAFFSGSETALTSARPLQLEVWIKSRKRIAGQARRALSFLKQPEKFLTTTLVGNNISLVIASSLMVFFLQDRLSGLGITLVSSVTLLFFGEILPKSMARERATLYTIRSTPPLQLFFYLLYPLIQAVLLISKGVLKVFGLKSESVAQFFSRKDLELLMREWAKHDTHGSEGNIHEQNLISRLILRGNQKIKEIMVPRTEMIAIEINEPVDNVAALLEKTGFSRIPVYEKEIDEITGMITARDIILEGPQSLRDIVREVYYTPDTKQTAALLREMQELQLNLAVIVDEYGGTAGLVTIEDIVEEFFGEILDEHDDDEAIFRNIGLKMIDANAKAAIEDINRRLNLDLPEGEYATLGGYLFELLGHIPKPGERIELNDCDIVIRSVYRRRIRWVRIILKGEKLALPGKRPPQLSK